MESILALNRLVYCCTCSSQLECSTCDGVLFWISSDVDNCDCRCSRCYRLGRSPRCSKCGKKCLAVLNGGINDTNYRLIESARVTNNYVYCNKCQAKLQCAKCYAGCLFWVNGDVHDHRYVCESCYSCRSVPVCDKCNVACKCAKNAGLNDFIATRRTCLRIQRDATRLNMVVKCSDCNVVIFHSRCGYNSHFLYCSSDRQDRTAAAIMRR